MEFKQFEERVKAAGLVARDCGNGHWRIENGRYEVNWWPFSKKRTIYVNGLSSGNTTRYGDCEAAIAAATLDPDIKRVGKRGSRKKSYRKEKRRLLQRDPRCHWCKCDLNQQTATLDHVIPLARGGSNATDNMVLSCEPCNKEKGNELWQAAKRVEDRPNENGSGSPERPVLGPPADGVPNRGGGHAGGDSGGHHQARERASSGVDVENVLDKQECRREISDASGPAEVDCGLRG